MNANYLGSHFIRKIEELLADNRHGVVLDLGRNTRQADRARGEEIAHLVKRLCNFVQGDLAGRLPEVGINGDADNAIKGQKGASTLLNDRGIDLALRNNISRLGIESRIVPDAFSKVSEGAHDVLEGPDLRLAPTDLAQQELCDWKTLYGCKSWLRLLEVQEDRKENGGHGLLHNVPIVFYGCTAKAKAETRAKTAVLKDRDQKLAV
eukprot:XP_001710280.1 Hypothetical protein GL50803_15135 [Giardia lamblia ATCC 50803]